MQAWRKRFAATMRVLSQMLDPRWPFNKEPEVERPTLHDMAWMGDFVCVIFVVVIALIFIGHWLVNT